MNGDAKTDKSSPRVRGYPLLALFFAVAASAILVSLLAPVVTLLNADEVSLTEFCVSSAIVSVVGMVLGAFIGLYHYRRLFGAGIGVITGSIIGLVVGPLVVSPGYNQIMVTCLGGSFLLLVLGAVCRILDRSSAPK